MVKDHSDSERGNPLPPEPEAKRKRSHVTVYDVIIHFEKTLEGLVCNYDLFSLYVICFSQATVSVKVNNFFL